MKTTAVRLYGKNDLRLETFELPAVKEDEILAKVVSDSICMSSHKAALQGPEHKRVPNDLAENPVIIGHEFCGELLEVGAKWKNRFQAGRRFVIQPALNYKGSLDAPGYSYRYIGGDATYIVIPNEVMEMDCLLDYDGDAFFYGSLTEPVSCLVGAMRASYHVPRGTYIHEMGIRQKGRMAILAGAGPMGQGLVDLAVRGDRKPKTLIVTDIDEIRLKRSENLTPPAEAAKYGVELKYLNLSGTSGAPAAIKAANGGELFDDVFVMAPVAPVIEQAGKLLAQDGCLNFFAGPTDTGFSANVNFYDIHYAFHHIVGTSGGNNEDLKISVSMMEKGVLNPAGMITHIGGLNSAAAATLDLPRIPGGKKLIYTHINLPLTAISDFAEAGKSGPLFAELAKIVGDRGGLWNKDAEDYLLAKAKKI